MSNNIKTLIHINLLGLENLIIDNDLMAHGWIQVDSQEFDYPILIIDRHVNLSIDEHMDLPGGLFVKIIWKCYNLEKNQIEYEVVVC